jgi:hypothetical protein
MSLLTVVFIVTGIIQVAFIILRVSKRINWHWGWVLSPSWILSIAILTLFTTLLISFTSGYN